MGRTGVIFDLDGVLVDTVPAHFKAWQHSFAPFDVNFDDAMYRELVDGRPVRDGARAVLKGKDEVAIDSVVAMKERIYLEFVEAGRFEVFDDVLPLLRDVSRRGIPAAVASSSNQARRLVALAGLTGHFEAIVCGDDVARGKPAPDIFLAAARILGLPPTQCIVVENSIAGLVAAEKGGFKAVGLLRDPASDHLPRAKKIITSLQGLESELPL